jgi:hypothetical protein
VAIIEVIFRYPDGHEERGPTIDSVEHFGIGQTLTHKGIRWKAVARRMVDDDPNRFAVIFERDDDDEPDE